MKVLILAMAASVNQDDLLEVLENEEGDIREICRYM